MESHKIWCWRNWMDLYHKNVNHLYRENLWDYSLFIRTLTTCTYTVLHVQVHLHPSVLALQLTIYNILTWPHVYTSLDWLYAYLHSGYIPCPYPMQHIILKHHHAHTCTNCQFRKNCAVYRGNLKNWSMIQINISAVGVGKSDTDHVKAIRKSPEVCDTGVCGYACEPKRSLRFFTHGHL